MKKPTVAIIGRPNVGKSTFVNRLVGHRVQIVDDTPGVTRDRAYYEVEWQNKEFVIVDTGGIVPNSQEEVEFAINNQVTVASQEANVIVFMVDGRDGVTALDLEITEILRKINKPILLAVNKIDDVNHENLIHDFYSLGLGMPFPLSALHGNVYVGDFLDIITQSFHTTADNREEDNNITKIAIVGRPNAGKSSLLNKILGKERMIVSDIAGTTRDAVNTPVTVNHKDYILVDTAGIRKKSKVAYGIEQFAVDRAITAIRDADVTLLVIDANEGITDQDKHIVQISNEAGKGIVIAVNKWDIYQNKTERSTKEYIEVIKTEMPHATFADIIFISALTGQRLNHVFEKVEEAFQSTKKRVTTSLLNQVINEAVQIVPPQSKQGKRLKIYFTSQVSTKPPLFVFFVNKTKLLQDNYKKYLENKIREALGFIGSPLRLEFKEKTESVIKKIAQKQFHKENVGKK